MKNNKGSEGFDPSTWRSEAARTIQTVLRVQSTLNGGKYLSSCLKVSKKVSGVEYAIRDIVLVARQVEKQGQKITYLNIGDPVQYGFQPPPNVKEAMIKAIQENQNYYAQSEGLPELREAIAQKEKSCS